LSVPKDGEATMQTFTIILAVLTILGTVGTFYFGARSMKLERLKNALTWKEVESGSLDLMKKAEAKFKPDILLMTSGPGAIVASLAMIQTRRFFPIYTAILEDKRSAPFQCQPKGHIKLSTRKWVVHLPEQLRNETHKRILVMDDCVISGDVQTAICEFLEENGFPKKNIFFATLVCSQIAIDTNKAPDLHWYTNPHKDLFFPWGKWF